MSAALKAVPINEFDVKPNTSIIAITPVIAKRWLGRNLNNRHQRKPLIETYARDMIAGNWQLTGESIKFDTEGTLLDGQHRLAAIMSSGVTVHMFVTKGLQTGSQTVMDTGAKRSAADALALTGQKHATLIASAARLAITVERGNIEGRGSVSISEIAEFIDNNQDILSAADLMRPLARTTDCLPAVLTYTYWVLAKIDTFDAFNFWRDASEKVGLQPGDPVIALTNRFAEARRNREQMSKSAMLSLIYRAWNARRDQKTATTMRVKSSAGGIIPIPDPR